MLKKLIPTISEVAEEAVEVDLADEEKTAVSVNEELIIEMKTIVLTIESQVGTKTVPMIVFESSCVGDVHDWSSGSMSASLSFNLEAAYFNQRLEVWEPLIESIDGRKPWELLVEMKKCVTDDGLFNDIEEDIEEVQLPPPKMSLNIYSADALELTVTKSALEVITNLSKAFSDAVDRNGKSGKKLAYLSSHKVKNETGVDVSLILKDQNFEVANQSNEILDVLLEPGAEVSLNLKEIKSQAENRKSIIQHQNAIIVSMELVRELSVTRVDKRLFLLPYRTYPGDQWGLVAEVTANDGCKIVTLRSTVKIFNNMCEAVEVYYMTEGGNELQFCGQVEAGSELNLPFKAVYTTTNEIFFRPSGNRYSVSIVPIVWKELLKVPALMKTLKCEPKDKGQPTFFINVVAEMEKIFFENTRKKTLPSTCFNIRLYSSVVFTNLLPRPVSYTLQGPVEAVILNGGQSRQLLTAEIDNSTITVKIRDYLNQDWECSKMLKKQMDPVWTFEGSSSAKIPLNLGCRVQDEAGYLHLTLYCPFWMINKTSLPLCYRRSKKSEKHLNRGSPAKNEDFNVVRHPGEMVDTPILFSFKPTVFFTKKMASIKVGDSEWSDRFTLDTVGSSGAVSCPSKTGISTEVGVDIRLSSTGLTKIVVFTPFYLIVNNASFAVQCREPTLSDDWMIVPSGQCIPFWPKTADKKLILRVAETSDETKSFRLSETHSTLLQLKNSRGGLHVDCHLTESSCIVTIDGYTNDPDGAKELYWSVNSKDKHKNTLLMDGIGECSTSTTESVYWASFLDDNQRVMLFTDDLAIATSAQCTYELERNESEIVVSLHGIGLSLSDDILRREVLYLALMSSGVVWESAKLNSKRWTPMNVKDCQILEVAFNKYNAELKLNKKPKTRQILDGKMDVDFSKEMIYRPNERKIRRRYQDALWMQMKSSAHNLQLHLKINRLQIDNQLFECVFPIVFAPVPLPKTVVADAAPKSFIEASIIQRKNERSKIKQFKYFKILIQEFYIKLDQGFINALIALFQPTTVENSDKVEMLKADLKVTDMDLKELAAIANTQEVKNFYDMLHFSPIKISISFSMQGGGENDPKKPTAIHSEFINLLLQSVGVTLTEIQDIVFKLGFFEKQHVFMSGKQLTTEVVSHYVAQAVKQMYVLVLGLDVIGNPFGLVMGLGKGIEDFFYEPFQGAVQGPEEFAEGLALGIRSLLGHTVGGAAGVFSRITGTLGKGVAALTMDDEYQKKRREALNKRPANLQQGLAQSGKGLVMGVYDGVTGVFVKPIEGAKQEGAVGFFKGVGKGVVGLVARPASGVMDFASGSFDAVKRVADLSEETQKIRPPRYFQSDGRVRPYNRTEAEGNYLLMELDKGKFAATDNYIAHVVVTDDGRAVLLITDRRVIMIYKGDIFGQWNCEWNYTWDELTGPPNLTAKGILFQIKSLKKGKKVLGLFGKDTTSKLVEIRNSEVAKWAVEKIKLATKSE
ncbi:hypothetical protein CHUAL_010483 [Chamberlinius hualienensis]